MRNFFDLVGQAARRTPGAEALVVDDMRLTYQALAAQSLSFAARLQRLEIAPGERLAIFLDKRVEAVVAMLGAAAAGIVFVPINPLLKPDQVGHILADCGARGIVTSAVRARILGDEMLSTIPYVILTDLPTASATPSGARLTWEQAQTHERSNNYDPSCADTIDTDLAALLYTSGSTGRPKGVMLSHRNLLEGAWSVAHYLRHTAEDRILGALPLSFDAGLSQLTTAWAAGATSVLVNYLMPKDVVDICQREKITGFAGVPPLWIQLARATWPDEARAHLRYFANTGGHMPQRVLDALRKLFPQASPYLMYGLTEAFRSTYLDPAEIDRRPGSIGKAVPNARILVVRNDGTPCAPNEVGELVHVGACVTLGYWNDPARTAQRYRPSPEAKPGCTARETAVWSGDLVRRDDDGFLYFVARNDMQIKSSGYRISPDEIEDVAHASGLVAEAVALGVPHDELGEAIMLVVVPLTDSAFSADALHAWCAKQLPPYMVPHTIVTRASLPRNPNGKFDRVALCDDAANLLETL
ncbi:MULTISPECIES: acyl-CoA ligase (AMP-forming), exosortase A system-associated [Burkholderia]|uniref:acyl-CoA ligase (AMP-forming), exosortase A system-associated n=1 Tax=Burkholderia TaxID=32008 RepID=UPI000841E367|nr:MULTISPECIES: acyl-CoA ligase (AMP-forming), exosortase A system-associated [unclassified Burkholderia]AOK32142.1 AMP-binding protein [Burkholderia sp. Bp7605]